MFSYSGHYIEETDPASTLCTKKVTPRVNLPPESCPFLTQKAKDFSLPGAPSLDSLLVSFFALGLLLIAQGPGRAAPAILFPALRSHSGRVGPRLRSFLPPQSLPEPGNEAREYFPLPPPRRAVCDWSDFWLSPYCRNRLESAAENNPERQAQTARPLNSNCYPQQTRTRSPRSGRSCRPSHRACAVLRRRPYGAACGLT